MPTKIKLTFLLFVLLFTTCNEGNIETIENIKLNEKLSKELVSLSVKCVDQKYPYKIGYRYTGENW